MKKYILLISIFIISALGVFSFANYQHKNVTPTETNNNQNIILQASQSGQNAFELLKAEHSVEFDQYDFGVLITSIDGLASNDENYWAIYLNNNYAQTGIDQINLEPSDKLELRYEKIKTDF